MLQTTAQNTPDILKKILSRKVEEISERKLKKSEQELKHRARDCLPTRGFKIAIEQSISEGRAAIIAEIKKASPSKGVICKNFDPELIAQSYEKAGATCLSVLTDLDFFQGSDEAMQSARAACTLPVLRKDFMIDPYQIYESRVLGADCILVIVSALSDTQIQELTGIATEIGLDVLVEIHNREELERGLMLRTPLIGINNRNLHTFTTDIETTIDLLPDVFHDRIVITESGINTVDDIKTMCKHGVDGFLIGEAFMNAENPGEKLRELFSLWTSIQNTRL